jgi:hypothetical protein
MEKNLLFFHIFCLPVVIMEINKKFRPDPNLKLMDQTREKFGRSMI